MTPSNEFHVDQFFFGLAVLCFGYAYMYRRTKVDLSGKRCGMNCSTATAY